MKRSPKNGAVMNKPKNTGDVVEIEVRENEFCYARVLNLAAFAFYDVLSKGRLESISEVINLPVIFKVPVMDYAITSGMWKVIGNEPLCEELEKPILYFNQDPISKKIFIYNDETEEYTPATKEECLGLECSAVWDPEHVEDRLRDHFSGVPNQWVESLALE